MANQEVFGGYIKPNFSFTSLGNRYYYASFRSALRSLIVECNIQEIYLPVYYCHDVTRFLENLKISINFYNIDTNFFPVLNHIEDGAKIIYPNYFGVCDHQAELVIDYFTADRVILDISQGFTTELNAFAVINSIRKFLPVPDGAVLATRFPLKHTSLKKVKKINYNHLLETDEGGAYSAYKKHELTFNSINCAKMSDVSKIIIGAIDIDNVRAVRQKNFQFLEYEFSKNNLLKIHSVCNFPLSYPLLFDTVIDKEKFYEEKIFIPTYWAMEPDLCYNEFERSLIESCVFLPIDQRYRVKDMEQIALKVRLLTGE